MAAVNKTVSVNREDESLPRQMNSKIAWLNRLRPGCVYSMSAQYGSQENQMFVMEVTVDGKVFQGIGPSRKRGRIMAAERALIYLGVLNAPETPIPDQSLEPYCWDDFSADIADGTTALYYDFSCLYQDCATEENLMELEDERGESEEFAYLEGRSTLAIIKELNPGVEFVDLSESRLNDGRKKFAMGLTVNGMEFTGFGSSKRLAKARAARDALRCLYRMDFKMSEDGIPVYKSGEDKWTKFKLTLEQKDYSSGLPVVKHAIQSLYEYFPELMLEFVDPEVKPGFTNFFVCNITIEGETFVGTGTNKKEAKTSAADSAMAAMSSNGAIAKIQEARREKKELKKKMKEMSQDWETKTPISTAPGKLHERFPDAKFELVAEVPFKKRVNAFVFSLNVDGKTYIGVGRSKKLARAEAAEKVLRELNMWTKEDKTAKHKALDDEWDDEEYVGEYVGEWGSAKEARWQFGGRRHGWTWGEYSDKELGMQARTIQDPCMTAQRVYCPRGNSSGGYGWPQGPDFSHGASHWGPRPQGSKRRFTSPSYEEAPFKRSHVNRIAAIPDAQKSSSTSHLHSLSTSLERDSLNSSVNVVTSSQNKNSASFSEMKSSSNISSQKDWNSYTRPATDFRQNTEDLSRCNTNSFVPRGHYNVQHASGSQNPFATYHSEQARFPSGYPFSQVASDHLQTQYPKNSPQPRLQNPGTAFNHYTDVNPNQGNAEFGNVSNSGFGLNSFKPEFNLQNQNFSKNPGSVSGSYSYGQYSGTNIMSKDMESNCQSTGYPSGISNPAMCSTNSVTRYSHQTTSSSGFPNANANHSAYNVPMTSDNTTPSSDYRYYGGCGTGDSYGYEQASISTNASYDAGTYFSSGINQTGADLNAVQNQIPPSYPYGGMQY